ncbi:MAG TPA: N-acetylmuramoyl-L-alanine amidase-like domain-containing protein [Blastocatellia bacterium]|nr:N-acetylmuramoyl-L-alanine amidase-like domain-containing protein [Blastocatellia bacterium]
MKKTRKRTIRPVGFDIRGAERALHGLSEHGSFEARVDSISRLFLGRAYLENPLGGGPDQRETFRCSFDEFDCVTYVEIVLALACSKTAPRFARTLRGLRYREGTVDWFRRNHFMTEWLRINAERGVLADITTGREPIAKTRTLSGVPGIGPEQKTFRCFPKRTFTKVSSRIQTGDVIMFVSTKKHLDVFHAGILVRRGKQLFLRNAARSAGKVIEQELREFLRANRMSGFILARPVCRP